MRDLLPGETARRRKLAARLLDHFALHGYELVTPPVFELADVLERGLGSLDPRDVLRFVEPESGEVAALRPDMTPQIARMAATRLADRPAPMRLSYEGTVLRRRQERARRHRQIPQIGVELVGTGAPDGDVELLLLAASAVRAAGLESFVVDLGHADIARALVAELPESAAPPLLDALAQKDAARVAELVRSSGLSGATARALEELPRLHGGADVWPEADAVLRSTPAAAALEALRDLFSRAVAAGLAPVLRTDFGEVRGFAYYTGAIFHLLADGPGEPIGSGGRYDRLLARFGAPMPAAGFALDLDNVAWALRSTGLVEPAEPKLLVAAGARSDSLCRALRSLGVACAVAPEREAAAYALAWEYSHLVRLSPSALELVDLSTDASSPIDGDDARAAHELATKTRRRR